MVIIEKFSAVFTILYVLQSVQCYSHWQQRKELEKKEKSLALGSSIKLKDSEKCVNQALMSYKHRELDRALKNSADFYPGLNFLDAAKYIETSDVFNFIKRMPKGAALHVHDVAMTSSSYLYKLTFTENLFVCWTRNNRLLLNFFQFHVDNRCEWTRLEAAREEEGFDDLLQNELSMATDIYKASASNYVAWNELLGTFATIEGLISYKPVFIAYLTEALHRLYEDNVMYVELRTMLLPVYDLEGNVYHPSDVATLLKDILEDFQCRHEDFLGGKIIYTPTRMVEYAWMDRYMEIMDELSSEHADFIAGFDLMGHEDLSYPLSKFVGSFQGLKNRVSFFFSAAETNWVGGKADLNLYDTILLKPSRIGHAFTLFNHPEILRMVKELNIAIEICPISNQMMMLVKDLRNHPGKFLISQGYPVVISSDNPGFWGARMLSHDWYEVFMAMVDRNADMRLLKQLAINSLEYSAISDKKKALDIWEKKWKQFITKMQHMCVRSRSMGFNNITDDDDTDILEGTTTESAILETPFIPNDDSRLTTEKESTDDDHHTETSNQPTLKSTKTDDAEMPYTTSEGISVSVRSTPGIMTTNPTTSATHSWTTIPTTSATNSRTTSNEDETIPEFMSTKVVSSETDSPEDAEGEGHTSSTTINDDEGTETATETTESEMTETASTGTDYSGTTDETISTESGGAGSNSTGSIQSEIGGTGSTQKSSDGKDVTNEGNIGGHTGEAGANATVTPTNTTKNTTKNSNTATNTTTITNTTSTTTTTTKAESQEITETKPGNEDATLGNDVENVGTATTIKATAPPTQPPTEPMPVETTTPPVLVTLSAGQKAKSRAVQAAKERSSWSAGHAARSTVAMRAAAS